MPAHARPYGLLLLLTLLLPHPAIAAELTSVGDIFTATESSYFGITSTRQSKDTTNSYYTVPNSTGTNTDDLTQPWFDVSNMNLIAEFDANGLLEYPFVYGPLAGYGQGADGQQQLFQATDFIAGTPWTFSIGDGSRTAWLNTLPNTSVGFAEQLFPKWTSRMNNLQVELVSFSPEQAPTGQQQPRAVILVLKVSNVGSSVQNVTLSTPPSSAMPAPSTRPCHGPHCTEPQPPPFQQTITAIPGIMHPVLQKWGLSSPDTRPSYRWMDSPGALQPLRSASRWPPEPRACFRLATSWEEVCQSYALPAICCCKSQRYSG
ncbi:MAG: hypothetical protein ACKO6N_11160 [Myxococcota bacterium]